MIETPSVAAIDASDALAVYAARIIDLHCKTQQHVKLAMQCVWECGNQLLAARELCRESGRSWSKWLEENCGIRVRQAHRYMSIARFLTLELTVSCKSIRQAVDLVSARQYDPDDD